MAVSAFRSRTSRGGNGNGGSCSSSSSAIPSSDLGNKIPGAHRRSRSVSAVSRNYGIDEFSNKRDNPLFCSWSNESRNSAQQTQTEPRARRGRSVSRVRDASPTSSRRRSSSSSRHPQPRGALASICTDEAEEKTIRAVSEQTKACPGNPDIYQGVRSEVRRAISEIQFHLENSQERGRKQQVERTVEELHYEPRNTNQKPHPRRKTSIERRKMSQRLNEEAMNYFDECVSISTFDSSDFSSTEDPPHILPASIAAVGSDRFLPLANSSVSARRVGTHFNNFEEFDSQEEMATGLSNSNLTISSKRKSLVKDADNVSDTNTAESMSSLFSFYHEPTAVTGIENEVRSYIKMFKKSIIKDSRGMKVVRCLHYDADDSVRWFHNEQLMFDTVLAKKKIESGSLLICSPRRMF
ncbi:hypothetical protein Scep_003058 [Stephania cephalantha]|uniref:Uncharacterized protein n=1 Tax=Stephania cephalantha TaxID=152367 RepID=A0AAP0KRH4_9MAGN